MACRIYIAYRIIIAIREHIMADNALSGGGIAVRIDESADGRIVISGLEIIEPGLYFSTGAMRPFLTALGGL